MEGLGKSLNSLLSRKFTAYRHPGKTFCSFQIDRNSKNQCIEQESSSVHLGNIKCSEKKRNFTYNCSFLCYGFQKSKHIGCQLQCNFAGLWPLAVLETCCIKGGEEVVQQRGKRASLFLPLPELLFLLPDLAHPYAIKLQP